MRKKISTGLIATNGDGLPCVHPPMPANWCHIPEADNVKSARERTQLKVDMSSKNISQSQSLEASSLNNASYALSDSQDQTNNDELDNSVDGSNSNDVEIAKLHHEAASVGASSPALHTRNILNPAVSEDSNVDVETEDQSNPMNNGPHDVEPDDVSKTKVVTGRRVADRGEHDESDAQYIEKQVVQSFLTASSSEVHAADLRRMAAVTRGMDSLPRNESSFYKSADKHGIALSSGADGFSLTNPMCANRSKVENALDAVSMTIANVAAGEGDPPEFLVRNSADGQVERAAYQGSQTSSILKQSRSSAADDNKKSRNERDMPASARLPVISSLLAPSSATSHPKILPGIQHIAPHGKTSNISTAVLPSVAHFLGPAKSPPVVYTPQKSSAEMYKPGLASSSNDDTASGLLSTEYQTSPRAHTALNVTALSSSKYKGNRKPVTPAGLRLSMAASEELPDPLPIPQFSDKVIRAKQLGTVTFDRPTVLRETVQFFLQFKHYWSSHDYDRISNLVVELFPEFKDSSDTPGVPANKRIRTDLSMYARNFRRREVSQRKKETGSVPSSAGQKSEANSMGTHESGSRTFVRSSSLANNGSTSAVMSSGGNPSDFCNELLTAASIIESQNTAVASRNGEANSVTQNCHKVKPIEASAHGQAPVIHKHEVIDEEESFRAVSSSNHHMPQEEKLDEEDVNTPIHFIYDKDTVTSRDANTAWQAYSEQMAQALVAGNSNLDYAVADEVTTDRLSAMAMWRSTTLPDPLPTPPYSDSVIRARESGNTMSARPKIIRETTQFFLALKLWWTAPDYERIAELVLQNFPALVSLQAIKKDLGTCARNMRRRLPTSKYKPVSSSQKWSNSHTGLELQTSDSPGSSVMQGTAEYMKALMAAQNMNLTELGMTQRNLGELAVLAGIKQRIEQHPQEVTDLERQYLAQCSNEEQRQEQRQALIASGAFGNDMAAMSALSAFYGLGMDIAGPKRGLGSSDYNSSETSLLAAGDLDVPNKRQRRISQAEVEKRLREAELNHSSSHHEGKSDGVSVDVSEKHLVKREPMSPVGKGLKTPSIKQLHQQLSGPGVSSYPSTSSVPGHEAAYWDVQAATNLALVGMTHPPSQQTATQAHSQAQIQHLPGHDPLAHPGSTEAPMNLTYHESGKHISHKLNSESPLPDSLPDTAGLAAQVEVTTSAKSHSPRKRNSISSRSSHSADHSVSSKDQVKQGWIPHGTSLKKESQEVVSLPEPLPVPSYSQKILSARDEGSSMRHRSEIIRETARFFLALKYWWSSADYTKISELVVQQFPDLRDDTSADGMTSYRRIQRDLSMCARNLRRSKKPRKIREITAGVSNVLSDASETAHISKKQAKASKSSSTVLSSAERWSKKSPGSSSKLKKPKSEPVAAVDTEMSASAGVSEEVTAAVALLQQQFMQSTSASSYHPSAHLLPSSHLLPPLHTHPALHDQQLQQHHHQQLQEENNFSMEEVHGAKRLMSEDPDIHEPMEHSHATVKSSVVAPVQRTATPAADESQVALSKSDHGLVRGADGAVLNKVGQQPLLQPTSTMKVYADPDHGCDLQERFSTLWKKGKFFDASLGVANKKLHVHKLVLLAMSPYLQETFKNADPRSQLEVNLPSDTTYETAKAFLKYIYEGILEVDTSSVRSLHKIATMLQMTKLAQFCQNFAQQLQEESEQASRVGNGGEGQIPKISVNLGELAEMQNQRQRHLEAQALHRLGETGAISSSDLQRTSAAHYVSEEHAQLKGDYLATVDQTSVDQTVGTPHYIHPDVLAQHRALMASSSSLQSSNSSSLLLSSSSSQDAATQQLLQAALARHQTSSLQQSPLSASVYQHHHPHMTQTDANAALLHRLSSPDSSVTALGATSLDHQQRLALAAYWQAHTLGELISRNQVTGLTSDPSALTSASELAAIAAAAAATTTEDTRRLLTNMGHEKSKTSHSRSHHSKEPSWSGQGSDSNSGSHATMLPETCIPSDMTRSHDNNTD